MSSTHQSGFVPLQLGQQVGSIRHVNDMIEYLAGHAVSSPTQKIVTVLRQWNDQVGAPSARHLLVVDQDMLKAIKGAMNLCLDIIEYGRASNTKAVRYIYAILEELFTRAESSLITSSWPRVYLDQSLRELFRPLFLAAEQSQSPGTNLYGQSSTRNDIKNNQARGKGNGGVRNCGRHDNDATSPIATRQAPFPSSNTFTASPAHSTQPNQTNNSFVAYPPPGAHPSFAGIQPAAAASNSSIIDTADIRGAQRRTRNHEDFPAAIIEAAQSAPPLPRPWFTVPTDQEWVAAEILLLVYEETRGQFHRSVRPWKFPINEWCRYRLKQWGFDRQQNAVESKRSRLLTCGWLPILEDQAEMLVRRGQDPDNMATRNAKKGLLAKSAPTGQTDDVWE